MRLKGYKASKGKEALTLDRVLSRFGIGSRAAAREAIQAGRLKVNGRVARDPDGWVRPETDVVHFDGKRLKPARRIYLALYKSKGIITSHGDASGRRTVYDLLGENAPWVVSIGRLDKDTTGLLLLTNDTDFANLISDPQSRIPKTYLVKSSGLIDDVTVARLKSGVRMKRGDWATPENVRRLEDRGKHTWLEIVLTEGKNREVRRMLEAVGFKVLKLVRTRIGSLTLKDLQIGRWRELTASEVESLRSQARSRRP